MTESEDVIGEAGCIGVVLLDPQLGLVINQSIEHMRLIPHSGVAAGRTAVCSICGDDTLADYDVSAKHAVALRLCDCCSDLYRSSYGGNVSRLANPADERLVRWAIVSDSAFRQRYEDLVNQRQLLLTWWTQDGSRC